MATSRGQAGASSGSGPNREAPQRSHRPRVTTGTHVTNDVDAAPATGARSTATTQEGAETVSDEAEDPLAEVGNKIGQGITATMMGARMAVEVARRMRSSAITEWVQTDSDDWKDRVRAFNPELVDAYDKGRAEGMTASQARSYAADVAQTNTAIRAREAVAVRDSQPAVDKPERSNDRAESDTVAARLQAGKAGQRHLDVARRAEQRHDEAYRNARDAGIPDMEARRVAAKEWHRSWDDTAKQRSGAGRANIHQRTGRTLGHYGDAAAPRQQPPGQAPNEQDIRKAGKR